MELSDRYSIPFDVILILSISLIRITSFPQAFKNDNPYIGLFNPRRSISFNKVKNLFIYNFSVMKRYILNKIVPLINYYDDSVSVKLIDGKLCGIYIDENKNKHIVSNICPHMKCNLIFNYVDKTWDCPCHGSRFDVDGNLIFGPSVYDIKIDKK